MECLQKAYTDFPQTCFSESVESREKHILDLFFFLLLLFNGFSLVCLVIIRNVWAILLSLTVLTVDFYWYYVRRVKGKKPRYPLIPPEGREKA